MPSEVNEAISNPNRILTANSADNVGTSTESQIKTLVRQASRFDLVAGADADATLTNSNFNQTIFYSPTADRTLTLAAAGSPGRCEKIRLVCLAGSSGNLIVTASGVSVVAGSAPTIIPGKVFEIEYLGDRNEVVITELAPDAGTGGGAADWATLTSKPRYVTEPGVIDHLEAFSSAGTTFTYTQDMFRKSAPVYLGLGAAAVTVNFQTPPLVAGQSASVNVTCLSGGNPATLNFGGIDNNNVDAADIPQAANETAEFRFAHTSGLISLRAVKGSF